MFASHRTTSITCGHCGYVQGVRLRYAPLAPNVTATIVTLGAWSIGWMLIQRRNARSNRKRCCAYCGEYLLAYTQEERDAAHARREAEMAAELSVPEPTVSTATVVELPRNPTPMPRSRRLPSQRVA